MERLRYSLELLRRPHVRIAILAGLLIVLGWGSPAFAAQPALVSPFAQSPPDAFAQVHAAPVDPMPAAPLESPAVQPFPTPPPAYMLAGENRLQAGLGSYCWSEGGQGLCIDTIGLPASQDTITLIQGIPFNFSFNARPSEPLKLSVYDLANTTLTETSGARMCQTCGQPLLELDLPPEQEPLLNVCLPTGNYLIALFGRWPQGDATYGFAVQVQEHPLGLKTTA